MQDQINDNELLVQTWKINDINKIYFDGQRIKYKPITLNFLPLLFSSHLYGKQLMYQAVGMKYDLKYWRFLIKLIP